MFAARLPLLVRASARSARCLSTTRPTRAITELTMPALSPTMTEGSVTDWKFKEGDSFVAGDVLLGIETDKASIDVEAQDDGIMGKILVPNGTSGVQVGAPIALLAEEGDDISNLKAPVAASAPSPAPEPTPAPPAPKPTSAPTPAAATASTPAPPKAHGHPTDPRAVFPSVLRLLTTAGISDASVIKATGHNGLLTKGDVLAYLGEIPSATGTEKAAGHGTAAAAKSVEAKKEEPKKPQVELDGRAIRQLIAIGLASPPAAPSAPKLPPTSLGFDDVLDQYLPLSQRSRKASGAKVVVGGSKKDSFDSVLGI